MKNTPKHMNAEELAVLAFLILRGTPRLSNINVDCFMEGYEACNNVLVHKFGDFLLSEAEYYSSEYEAKRREACGYSGQPITTKHDEEFVAAKRVASLLKQAGEIIKQYNLLG